MTPASPTETTPRTADDLTATRQDVRVRLATALHALAERGCSEGVAGHVTARDPRCPTDFWVNPFGVHFADVRPADLLRVTAHGDVVSGDGILNAAAFAIHAAVHHARPDVGAVAHAHSAPG